jgi:translation initiation factor 1|eukprot:CAMPEP_0116898480 /NCGR_PEP_ID=MMETSP0467-20121206/7205_1 /TAXON_ID=283647 /ORGANISM="Mesodinium pulex, Strain SPMC105" /LENGTH=107 /DNA_ID=CAMNT_0004570655 /DNA_START=34 /DNA_END=357 /DNA_ORIENTATION=+
MDIKNLALASDPFAAKDEGQDNSKIHVRVQQRNGRKCITTVAGLPDDLDLKKITRALKKTFQCNGTVHNDEESGEIVQLSGDQRTNIREFFVDQEICREDQIVIHGG